MSSRQERNDPGARQLAAAQATAVQHLAADPDRSVILRASAGAGKTKALIDRLLRLLISGREMKSVVAMTFTRKAAVEIRERLLERIGRLALARSDELTTALDDLLRRKPTAAELARASLLAEELLEDPMGLHVGTIHTFCQTLLSRFADEAGVDPAFGILDSPDELWQEALDLLERDVARDPASHGPWARLATSPDQARERLNSCLTLRMELDRWAERLCEPLPIPTKRIDLLEDMSRELQRHLLEDTPLASCETPCRSDLLAIAAERALDYAGAGLDAVQTADQGVSSAKFTAAVDQRRTNVRELARRLDETDEDAFAELLLVVLTASFEPRQFRPGSKQTKPQIRAALAEVSRPIRQLHAADLLLFLAADNGDLLRFGLQALDHYEALKRRDRVLDFHDLEERARQLVTNKDLGQWILYRMDSRLDHLLVDEFQDTNRNQWDLVAPFADEFVSGCDDEGRPRSVFFVGDVKQSIYRFRGACPEIFGETIAWLGAMRDEPVLTLPTNFRSLPAIIETVGEAFRSPPLRDLLPDDEIETVRQLGYRDAAPGRVCIHSLDEDEENGPTAHERSAQKTVEIVKEILARGRVRDADSAHRPANLGDILLLCRNRTHLEVYERAFRNARLPFVPAGRGALARSREIQDVLALLRWLTFPADGVALCTVLRSPLLRISEAELHEVLAMTAHKADLWRRLRQERPPALDDAVEILNHWLGRIGLESTHDLLRRIFRDTNSLDRFELALGEQARFNLLRLHDLALAHDQSPFPSLRGFIRRIERAAVQKDQEEATLPDTDRGRVQMLTIHGAKGLERPYVLLVDAAMPMSERLDHVVFPDPNGRGALLQGATKNRLPSQDFRGPILGPAVAATLETNRREEANLLYVAMTRARDELHVLGITPTSGGDRPSHHDWLCRSLELTQGHGDRGRADVSASPDEAPGPASAGGSPLRIWDPSGCGPQAELISASSLVPDRELPADGTGRPVSAHDLDAAARRGTAIHLWLQRAAETGTMPPGEGEEWDEARAVFENPRHDAVFRPAEDTKGYCEIGLLHNPPDTPITTYVQGVIDRLLVGPGTVTIVDYKSHRTMEDQIPALAELYRPQLEAYRAAVAAIYPERVIETVLLFTHLGPDGDRGRLVPLP